MDIGIDISLYPLAEHFAPVIHECIERLSAHPSLKVVPGSLSTQVYGEYEQVFEALREAVLATLEARIAEGGKAAFVLKILGPL
ncbi:MAG: YkoF family thiamine/hydroxymethylpyrimidine-binding protein [Steroidobacteraceae bacterium]